jgi:hypothetical protein
MADTATNTHRDQSPTGGARSVDSLEDSDAVSA